jgi:hypothetical protein
MRRSKSSVNTNHSARVNHSRASGHPTESALTSGQGGVSIGLAREYLAGGGGSVGS